MQRIFIALAMAAIGSLSTVGLADSTIVVSPGNLNGWAFHTTDVNGTFGQAQSTGTTAGLVNGPATPPLGTGSANFVTGTGHGDDSAQMRLSAYSGTLLTDITTLVYSTYASSFNGSQLPWLKLYLSNGDALVFEPTYSSAGAGNGDINPQPDVAANEWQTWNALTGMWYSDNDLDGAGPGSNAVTWATIIADEELADPGVTLAPDSSQGGVIRFTSGQSAPSDHYDTNVDAFKIGISGVTTTYDFEATAATPVPLPGAWGTGLLTLGLSAVYFRLRNRRARKNIVMAALPIS